MLDLSTPTIASVAATAGFQPEIVPSSLAKMKRAGPEAKPLVTAKLVVPLNTTPVGAPGTVTVRPSLAPVLPLYSVATAVPLSDTHHGEVPLETRPQAFTRSGSTRSAGTAPSDTRLCCL